MKVIGQDDRWPGLSFLGSAQQRFAGMLPAQ
jgi:hypothetical protein